MNNQTTFNSELEEGGPICSAEQREMRLKVRWAVAQLPRRYQQAIFLRYDQGLKSKEIAALLQTAPGTVDGWFFRAAARLRELLKDFAD